MAELKQYKESENKVHEQLYDSLFLLSQIYPTSKDFNAVFKKDMFVKNNKAAFFEVVYFLLDTLNPELTKTKITTWPPFEIKRENKFRAEVLKYINELNTLYDNADIPHIMSSHLISPGGFKFAKFMLKLSQLVVYEHLRKTESINILHCLRPSKNVNLTKASINNLKKKTALIEEETMNSVMAFEHFHFESNEKALSINKRLTDLDNQIRDANHKNAEVREEFHKRYPSYPSFESLEEKLFSLKKEWDHLQEVQNMFVECERLMTYLSSNELVLEHDKDEFKVPNEISHILKKQDELDLNEFLHALNMLLEQKALELPNPTNSFITSVSDKVTNLKERYIKLHDSLTEGVQKLYRITEKMTTEFKELAMTVATEEEVLAVPLVDSDKSD